MERFAGVYKNISSLNKSKKVVDKLNSTLSTLTRQSKVLGEAGSKALD